MLGNNAKSYGPGSWDCPSCQFSNYPNRFKCYRCDCLNPSPSLSGSSRGYKRNNYNNNNSKHSGYSNSSAPFWSCRKCNIRHDNSVTKCTDCNFRKPFINAYRPNNSSADPIGYSQGPGTSCTDLNAFVLSLKKLNENKMAETITNFHDKWRSCWSNFVSLSEQSRDWLVINLAKIPCSSKVLPPPISACKKALEYYLSFRDAKSLSRCETTINVVKRLLDFRWDADKEHVKSSLASILVAANSSLDITNSTHRTCQPKIMELLSELEKPWVIKLNIAKEVLLLDTSESSALLHNASEWHRPTIAWLSHGELFQPPSLPIMKIPSSSSVGVYHSAEEYFDTIERLWIALTFGEGNQALSPRCRYLDRDIPCGRTLWSIPSSGSLNCRVRGCLEPCVLACSNRHHSAGLCPSHARKEKQLLCGKAGPQASTHVYDGSLVKVTQDNVLYIERFVSRHPPKMPIHWKSTSRLSSPNLVAVIKTQAFGTPLNGCDIISWGQIVVHDQRNPRDECFKRDAGQLAISLLSFDDVKINEIEFRKGDSLAIIDCQTFVPEFIPILNALETQKRITLPFQGGALLNITAPNSKRLTDDELGFTIDKANDVVSQVILVDNDPLAEIVSEMVQKSTFDPLVQIRNDNKVLANFEIQLVQLLRNVTLDTTQLIAFLSSLANPVHCTQGPPGTGKSYLGVVIARSMLIIRKFWKQVNPSIGRPPILVLSYKNHAIDEFLGDIVDAEPQISLVRVGGGCSNPKLDPFVESRFLTSNRDVTAKRMSVENVFMVKNSMIPTAKELQFKVSLLCSDIEENSSPQQIKDYNALQYDGIVSLMRQLCRLKHVLKLVSLDFLVKFTLDPSTKFSDSNQPDIAVIKKLLDNSFLDATSQNLPVDFFKNLFEGIQHYPTLPMQEVLLKWIHGFKPRPKCSRESCKDVASKHDSSGLCSLHRCAFPEEPCLLEVVSDWGKFCNYHSCGETYCEAPKPISQDYCTSHSCFVCVSLDRRSGLALDDPPRNSCQIHKLCCAIGLNGPCFNLAAIDSSYCTSHNKICGFKSKSGVVCIGRVIDETIPFCRNHQHLKSSSAPRTSRRTRVGFCSATTKKNKACRGKALPNSAFCHHHLPAPEPLNCPIPERKEILVQEVPEDPIDVLIADPSSSTPHPNHVPLDSIRQELDEENLGYSDDEEFVDVEESFAFNDNMDEVDEADHLQHLREVFEVDPDIDEILVEEPTEIAEVIAEISDSDIIEWIPPPLWSWEMDLTTRSKIICQVSDLDNCILKWIDNCLSRQIETDRREYKEAKVKASSSIYENKEIVGGTIVGCVSRLDAIRKSRPFAIIVEEASEVMEPLLFAAIGPSTCKLEMIGDHLQLQPSAMNKFDFERINKINISLFERLIRAPGSHYVPSSVLSIQRRMRTNIADLTRGFYKDITEIVDHEKTITRRIGDAGSRGKLLRHAETEGREVPGVLPHVFFWKHEGKQSVSSVGLSKVNNTEAEMVFDLAKYLVKSGVPKPSIAILTPYKGQLMEIRKKMMNGSSPLIPRSGADSVIVSTVDRFQGDESDIVIISLVTDSKSTTPFVKLVNRMIVLLSRARLGMYIIGNPGYFENKSVEHWQKTFELLEQPAKADSASDVSVYEGPRLGSELPICCPAHRVTTRWIYDSKSLTLGFCEVVCQTVLPCTHPCSLKCHYPIITHNKHCKVSLDSPCIKHPEQISCKDLVKPGITLEVAIANFKCPNAIDLTLPCGHVVVVKCFEEDAILKGISPYPKCQKDAFNPYIYPVCKHFLKCKCNLYDYYTTDPSRVPLCQEMVDFTSPCGHSVLVKCSVKQQYDNDVARYTCTKKIDLHLPRCRHKTAVSCSVADTLKSWSGNSLRTSQVIEGAMYGEKDYVCLEKVELILKCGHILKDLSCGKAFEYSKNPPICMEREEIVSPLCGHEIQVTCHDKGKLATIKRGSIDPVSTFEASNHSSIFLNAPSSVVVCCNQEVVFKRQCGHSETMVCDKARQGLGLVCGAKTIITHPLCQHELSVPCKRSEEVKNWNPWSEDAIKSESFKMIGEGVVQSGLSFNPCGSSIKSLVGNCNIFVLFAKSCGHSMQVPCKEAFQYLQKKGLVPECREMVLNEMPCGHSKEIACLDKGNDCVCDQIIEKSCWNYENCGQKLNLKCSFGDKVCCATETKWTCKEGHELYIPICANGAPQGCPFCSIILIDNDLAKISLSKVPNNTLDSLGFSLKPPVEIEMLQGSYTSLVPTHSDITKFLDAKKEILLSLKQWLERQDPLERPLFSPHVVPVYIELSKKQKDLTSFDPNVLARETPILGINIKEFTAHNIEHVYEHMNGEVTLLVGFGFVGNAHILEKLGNNANKKKLYNLRNATYFDSIQIIKDSSITFLDPYCLYSTSKITLNESQLAALLRNFNETKSERVMCNPLLLNYKKASIQQGIAEQKPGSEALSLLRLKVSSLLAKTPATGMTITFDWDTVSLVNPSKRGAKALEKEIRKKLLFISHAEGNPFSGTNYLKKLDIKKNWDDIPVKLLLSLELFYLKSPREAQENMEEYIRYCSATNKELHPLILVALGRLLSSNLDKGFSLECFQLFALIFPAAKETWLNKLELDSPRQVVSSDNYVFSVRDEWESLKARTGCTSRAIEKLLDLTGLKRVKQEAVAFFKSAMAISKMSAKDRSNNSLTLNFAFLGNPGTGKTTVARLFSEILYDSGMRKKKLFNETTAQKLKDDGPDKFRDLVQDSYDGTIFIDEAYDLDPAGDFKGKGIVSELLTFAENDRDKLSIIIAGYEDDMHKKLYSYNEGLKSRFNEIMFDDFDKEDLLQIWNQIAVEKGWTVEPRASEFAVETLFSKANRRGFGNARAVRTIFEEATKKAFSREEFDGKMFLSVVDVIGDSPVKNNPKLALILKEFNEKIGWKSIKKSVKDLVDLAEKNYERSIEGLQPLPMFMNRLFLGNPGTGKTVCSKLYGRLLKQLNYLSNGDVVLKTASDLVGSHGGESQTKTVSILEQAKGKVLVIDEAYNLDDSLYGKQVLDVLVEKIQGSPSDDIAVLLLGYESQMVDMLRTQNPGLARRFPKEYAFSFEDYSDFELLEIFNQEIARQNISVSSVQVSKRLIDVLSRQKASPNFGNVGSLKLLLQSAISKAVVRGNDAICLEPDDIEVLDQIETDDPFRPLRSLYNVQNIIEQLISLNNGFKVAREEGDDLPEVGHFVFRGSPGTGKTTVARAMADILFNLELVASKNIVETSGLALTGDFVGQTKSKVAEQLGKAKGGVLFIDEAYELGKGHFGEEAMTTLIEAMTSPDYKGLVIIIAGYPKDIDTMLDRNAGFKSRFTRFFDFHDWLASDALAYFLNQAAKENFELSEEIHVEIKDGFEGLRSLPGFGNGRDVKKVFNDVKTHRASRVINAPETEKSIVASDIQLAFRDNLKNRQVVSGPSMTSFSERSFLNDLCQLANDIAPAAPSHNEKEKVVEIIQEAVEERKEIDHARDPGVSDKDWEELCKAKEAARLAELAELARIQAEQDEPKRLDMLQEMEDKAKEVQEKLRRLSNCPMGFGWIKVGGGWRCRGGSHFVSDSKLENYML